MPLSYHMVPKIQMRGCRDKAMPLHCVWCYQCISAPAWMVLPYLNMFFHNIFLISLRGAINQVTPVSPQQGRRWCSAGCQHAPFLLELQDGSRLESAACAELQTGCSMLSLMGNEKDIGSFVSSAWS